MIQNILLAIFIVPGLLLVLLLELIGIRVSYAPAEGGIGVRVFLGFIVTIIIYVIMLIAGGWYFYGG
jgi:hypothetical protein